MTFLPFLGGKNEFYSMKIFNSTKSKQKNNLIILQFETIKTRLKKTTIPGSLAKKIKDLKPSLKNYAQLKEELHKRLLVDTDAFKKDIKETIKTIKKDLNENKGGSASLNYKFTINLYKEILNELPKISYQYKIYKDLINDFTKNIQKYQTHR
jgi:hypothetical protein